MKAAPAAALALWLGVVGAAGAADAKPLREAARVAIADGVIGEGFALDERGARLAYFVTDGKGVTRLHVGPPSGAARAKKTDLTPFSNTPERVVSVGPGWFVIANEGQRRRAVAVTPSGALGPSTSPFSDAFVSAARGSPSPVLVTVTDRGERDGGHAYEIAAFRAGGASAGRRSLTLAGDGTIAGAPDLSFQAFTNGYLAIMARRAGRYDAHADARRPTEIASYDVLKGAVTSSHGLGDPRRLEQLVVKRNEKPGIEAFVHLDDQASGLELVGPGEKLRPLALPGKLEDYDPASLEQQHNGGRLYISLVRDPVGPGRALQVLEVGLGTARATPLGEIPLGDDKQPYVWVAGGDKVAFMRKNLGAGGSAIVIYQR